MTPTFSDYQVTPPDFESTRATYEDLTRQLHKASDAGTCIGIVNEWDTLLGGIKEWASLTEVRFQQNTRDETIIKAKDHLHETLPRFLDLETSFKKELLESPHRDSLTEHFGPQLFALWECDARSFSPAIKEDMVAESKRASDYTSLVASAEFEFRGKTLTFSGLAKYQDDSDRACRKEAHEVASRWCSEHQASFDSIYDDLVKLRHRMATTLGYPDFVAMAYQRMRRIGYEAEDVVRFRQEVSEHVVPLACEIAGKQQELLGVDRFMYWDTPVHHPDGNPAPRGDHDWMIDQATTMFRKMGHGLDTLFEDMKERCLIDLKARPGKAEGGFCDFFNQFGYPFIFANFNGTRGDVDVFAHEMGHAYQSYQSREQAHSDLVWPTTEACEIHSMGLEFLTWPHMDLFYGDEADRLRRIHLAWSLQFIPYGVTVDHFQHLVYAEPDASPKGRNRMWQTLERQYLPWWDFGPLAYEGSGRLWQMKQHLFNCPFYYIDYTLALTCALQFWQKSRTDRDATMESYARLCRRGGRVPFHELTESAGLKSPFERGCLAEVVADARAFLLG
ncbi:MAG: M3 family oligoendopeptidase [Verrucomicrobiota bacterium]